MDTREDARIRRTIQKLADEKGVTFEQARELLWAERNRPAAVLSMPRGKGSRSPYKPKRLR